MESLKDYDFVRKTQEILSQYESLNLPVEKNYDVTLFINACVGLLFVANERRIIPPFSITDCGLGASVITKNDIYDNETELEAVCRHVRNSIAHKRFKSSGNPIDTLYFDDKKDEEDTFHMEIKVEHFKIFVLRISQYLLDNNG